MAALTSSDVTVVVTKMERDRKQKRNMVTIAFGDGSKTYPSGGVPMPAKASFGLVNDLRFLSLYDQDDASGIVWKYDADNNKLRGYIQGIVVSAAGAATMDDFALDTTADPLSTAVSVSLTNNTGAGTKYLGKMLELTTTHAPAAQALRAEAVGY